MQQDSMNFLFDLCVLNLPFLFFSEQSLKYCLFHFIQLSDQPQKFRKKIKNLDRKNYVFKYICALNISFCILLSILVTFLFDYYYFQSLALP